MTAPLVNGIKSRCRRYLGAAKAAWGQLTQDDGLKSEGRAEAATGRSQEREGLAHREAENKAKASGKPEA
jgi:hypothetical protein